jgi:ABC-type oligopeptide transport system ATPase subunit
MSKATLELKNVSKLYRVGKKEVHALNPISFDLLGDPARIITVAGESGSGKTTLASIMLGLLDPTTGQVLYEGKDVSKLSGSQYRDFRKNVQAVFQDPFAVFNPFYQVDHLDSQKQLVARRWRKPWKRLVYNPVRSWDAIPTS